MAYKLFASGYLVVDGKVLLVHHNKFDKWTPPGGHMESDETQAETVVREFKEETNLDVTVIPFAPPAFDGDDNATPIPLPFHMDLEVEGFDVPHIGHFFFVQLVDPNQEITHQEAEVHGAQWFSKEELKDLKTFEQVRALANYALDHYPN
jgi:8-oxo-dGTP pyrophosphatase MutT (NUDIX family)